MVRKPLAIALLAILVLSVSLSTSPVCRRFDVADRSISKPYVPNEFVSYRTVVLVAAILPGVLFLVGFRIRPLPPKNELTFHVVFAASILSTSATVEGMKRVFGRLRPDFLSRCVPANGVCTGDKVFVGKGRVSFPSGHSAVSFCGLVFLVLMIHTEVRLDFGSARLRRFTRGAVYAGLLLAPLAIAASRVVDNRHFISDVVVGGMLGSAAAITGFSYASRKALVQAGREDVPDKMPEF
jgi:diacylglycerol diphosphate phosphatase / phosphatidate phosphatase